MQDKMSAETLDAYLGDKPDSKSIAKTILEVLSVYSKDDLEKACDDFSLARARAITGDGAHGPSPLCVFRDTGLWKAMHRIVGAMADRK